MGRQILQTGSFITPNLPSVNEENHAQEDQSTRSESLPSIRTKKVVPFTEIEWKFVKDHFMNDDLESLTKMRDLISMWVVRMWHEAPVIIGISELMMRALVLDRKHVMNIGISSADLNTAEVGLIFGSVIIRFVNYVNELCQPEGKSHIISIADAVSKMKIPTWIVDIRHDATHKNMPPLNMMREAIMHCRRWLWRTYWNRPFNEAIKEALSLDIIGLKMENRKNTLGHRMVNAMINYKEWRKKYPNVVEYFDIEGQPTDKSKVRIEALLDSNAEEFMEFFAQSVLANCCLPARRNFFSSPTIFPLSGNVFPRKKQIDAITYAEQKYYKPLFQLICEKGSLPLLMVEVVRLISNGNWNSAIHRRHLSGWAKILLAAYLKTEDSVSIQNWRSVLKSVVLAPQFFHDEQIISLLDMLGDNISDKCRSRITKLLKIRETQTENNAQPNVSILDASILSVKSLSDLQNRIMVEDQTETTFVHDPLTLEDDWSIAMEGETGSLGLTEGQIADTLCLAIGCDIY